MYCSHYKTIIPKSARCRGEILTIRPIIKNPPREALFQEMISLLVVNLVRIIILVCPPTVTTILTPLFHVTTGSNHRPLDYESSTLNIGIDQNGYILLE